VLFDILVHSPKYDNEQTLLKFFERLVKIKPQDMNQYETCMLY